MHYNLGLQKFVSQDRENPDWVVADFHQIPFNAKLASQAPSLSNIVLMPGVDGFVMDIDPLYKVSIKLLKGNEDRVDDILYKANFGTSEWRFNRSFVTKMNY